MRLKFLLALTISFLSANAAFAQKHEVGLLIGGMSPGDNRFETPPQTRRLGLDAGLAYQVYYAYRLVDARLASIYVEAPLVVTPNSRFDTSVILLPRGYSSVFFTPGLKLKLLPGASASPYAAIGFGLARLNPSGERVDGRPFTEGGAKHYTVYDFGAGIDVKVFPFVSLRGEARDFVSGTPQFNVNLFDDRQHNVVVSGGVALRF